MATATQTKQEKARFEAPGKGGLRVILEPVKEKFSDSGIKQPVPGTGHTVVFMPDGAGAQYFETADTDEINKLRIRINEGAPFFEVPVPKPPSAPTLSQIAKLAAKGDVDGLVELAKAEEAEHQREDVMETIAEALESMGG